jgi:hemerythrin-like domain-containing protein
MSDFIDELRHDHRVIQQVVAGMSAVAELLDSGKQVDPSVLADLVQFLRVFADQCHHEKEEQYLFPLLATKANGSARRELESLEREHRAAKQLVGQLAKVAAVYLHNPAALRYRVIDLLQQLVELYPAHIWKEDFLLFPLAQQNLSPAERQNLEEQFENVEREVGEDVRAGFEMLAQKLEAVVEYRNSVLARCALRQPRRKSLA